MKKTKKLKNRQTNKQRIKENNMKTTERMRGEGGKTTTRGKRKNKKEDDKRGGGKRKRRKTMN